jgi:hypothetical protein
VRTVFGEILTAGTLGAAGLCVHFGVLVTPPSVVSALVFGVLAMIALLGRIWVASRCEAAEQEQAAAIRAAERSEATAATDQRLADQRAAWERDHRNRSESLKAAMEYVRACESLGRALSEEARRPLLQPMSARPARPRLPEALRTATPLGLALETLETEMGSADQLLTDLEARVPASVDRSTMAAAINSDDAGRRIELGLKANQPVFDAMAREQNLMQRAIACADRVQQLSDEARRATQAAHDAMSAAWFPGVSS